jgi:hypothetical protein
MVSLDKLQQRDVAAKEKRAKKKPLEKDVEGPVKDYARSKKFYVRKFKSENNRSVPDDIFATPKGTVFFVEFKRPGKKATPAQHDEHEFMRKSNLQVHVIDNVEAGKALIDQYLAEDAFL